MTTNLTTGSISKNLFTFALPFFCASLFQTLYGTVDLFIIGIFCDAAVTSAVSTGSQIMHFLTSLIISLAVGSTVLIASCVGRGKPNEIRHAAGGTVIIFAVAAVFLAVLLSFLVEPILKAMSTPDQAFFYAGQYLRICFLGIPLIVAYNVIACVYQGLGDTKTPMYLVMLSCIINVAADFLFIGVFHMGALGAALGTVGSQGIAVLSALIIIKRTKPVPGFCLEDCRPQGHVLKQILRVGIPVMVQDALIHFAFLFIMMIANTKGVSVSAAVGIVEKIICVLFLIPSSMRTAVASVAAQNFGAGFVKRADSTMKTAAVFCMISGIILAVLFQFIADDVVALFTKDAAVIMYGTQYLRAYVFDCIFAGIHFSVSGWFNAGNRSNLTFIHNAVSALLFRIPLSWLAATMFPYNLTAMGWAPPIGSVFSMVFCIIAYFVIIKKRQPEV